jgi:hypothetical protein
VTFARSLFVIAATATPLAMCFIACIGDDPVTPPAAESDGSASAEGSTPPSTEDAGATADSGAENSGDSGKGPPRFCETKSPVTGVADYLCADFDGNDVAEGFTSSYVPDGGVLRQATDLHFSAPASFESVKGALLLWQKAGPTQFQEIDLQFRIFIETLGGAVPPSTGHTEIIEIGGANAARAGIRYARNRSIEGSPNYTGYYMEVAYCPSACALWEKALPTAPPQGAWVNVRIVWTKAGLLEVSYNDIKVMTESTGIPVASTSVRLKLGLVPVGDAPLLGRHLFDNVIVSAKRE